MSVSELNEAMKGRFDVNLGVVHNFSDNLYAKQMTIPKGFMIGKHRHNYSHLSILAKGVVLLRTDEGEQMFEAPACIEIKKDIDHTLTALEDSVWYCIHATDETDIDKIDEVLINKGE